MTGHTPGPWGVEDLGESEALAIVANYDAPFEEWKLLGSVQVDTEQGVLLQEMEANARLMAAAPDLLSVAKAARAIHEEECPARGSCSLSRVLAEAIAKAEGTAS